ncbi:N-acetylmuramoyl-L-alanine amidase [Myxococcaceae bacterium GXIMD 01537]
MLKTLALSLALGTLPEPSPTPPAWPAPGAALTRPSVAFPPGFGKKRIYLDAGHGAAGNTGNQSVTCEDEQDFTLRVALDLQRRLEATGHFTVRLSRREPGQQVAYPARVAAAEAWGAHAFLSLHSDARGEGQPWQATPERQCVRQDATPGFSVLWADEAAEPLKSQRVTLARALARSMGSAGFLAYDGVDYTGLYDGDAVQPGVFVDRHEPGKRVMVLRRPRVPSVIIETHHALDFEEAERWKEARTLDVFAATVAQGLVEALTPPASARPPAAGAHPSPGRSPPPSAPGPAAGPEAAAGG